MIETRAKPLGIEVVEATLLPDLPGRGLPEGDFFGVIMQVPGRFGPHRRLGTDHRRRT